MKWFVSTFIGIFCLAVLSPVAQAAVTAETAVPCRANNAICWPAAFAFTPNDKVYYAERYTGQIRVYDPATDEDTLWKTISHVATDGEQGVLGLALDPRWPDKKWVYVYYTYDDPLKNRVIRLRKKGDGNFVRQRLLTAPAASNHNGGVIKFGPDGKLYVVTGETGDPDLAQDFSSKAGKVLRLKKDGSAPSDNPLDGSVKWYSYGHRNMFGLAFDPLDLTPESVEVWVTENGPECNDEVNFVEAGNNYGWGSEESCPDTNQSGDNPVEPVFNWDETIAVTGAVFCNNCNLTAGVEGDLFVGAWNTGAITRLDVNSDRDDVGSETDVYSNGSGVLGMSTDSTGNMYFSDAYGIHRLVD